MPARTFKGTQSKMTNIHGYIGNTLFKSKSEQWRTQESSFPPFFYSKEIKYFVLHSLQLVLLLCLTDSLCLVISEIGGREHLGSSGKGDHQCFTEVYSTLTHSNTHSDHVCALRFWHKLDLGLQVGVLKASSLNKQSPRRQSLSKYSFLIYYSRLCMRE